MCVYFEAVQTYISSVFRDYAMYVAVVSQGQGHGPNNK